jgi:hypothetical protein
MSRFESNVLSPDDPFEREQLLVGAEVLRAAQTDMYAEVRNYARNSLVDADTLRQAFPAQYEQLTSAVEQLTGRVVAGDYGLLTYYRDDDDSNRKIATPFGDQLGGWRTEKRFIGILQGLATITHGLPLKKDAEFQRLTFVIDPIELLPESKERSFYMRNYISGRLENPFNDVQNPGGRVFLPVDGVSRLDIDRAYLSALENRARFLGAAAEAQPPENDAD